MKTFNNFNFCDECEVHMDCVTRGSCIVHIVVDREKHDTEAITDRFIRDNDHDDDD